MKPTGADYSNFPFGEYTVGEIFALMRESKDIGDTEFVNACREAIRLNKCRPDEEPKVEASAKMKAISLLEPWATMVRLGAKHIETRSWNTKYRGRLAIHASKGKKFVTGPNKVINVWPFSGILTEDPEMTYKGFPYGCIVATCDLIDCVKMSYENLALFSLASPAEHTIIYEGIPYTWKLSGQEHALGLYSVGRYMWFLANIKPMERPVPAKGSLSIWEWDPSL